MQAGLAGALGEAGSPDVRAVVVTGAGRGFCVGQDLAEFRRESSDIPGLLRGRYHPNIIALRALEKPVIAAVNGAAAGAGLSLACACDIRIAADRASFVPAFINIGLVPDSGGTFFVTRLVGYARAFEWLCSGRRLTAAEAHAWGVVSEVVGGRVPPAAALAQELDALPTAAIGKTKRLLDRAATAALEEQLELEAELQGAATASEGLPRRPRRVPREAAASLHRALSRGARVPIQSARPVSADGGAGKPAAPEGGSASGGGCGAPRSPGRGRRPSPLAADRLLPPTCSFCRTCCGPCSSTCSSAPRCRSRGWSRS